MKRYEYPKITEKNFEEMTKRFVISSYDKKSLRVRKPKTRNEFYNMTKNMFGIGLTFTGWMGSYEIVEEEDWYSELPVPKLWDTKYHQYVGLKPFLEHTFGKLYCGGVAGSHYGQYRYKYRNKKRLEKLYSSKLSIRLPTGSNQTDR